MRGTERGCGSTDGKVWTSIVAVLTLFILLVIILELIFL
nr:MULTISPECIES: YjcZ family sporulation protein [Paenibacillus]